MAAAAAAAHLVEDGQPCQGRGAGLGEGASNAPAEQQLALLERRERSGCSSLVCDYGLLQVRLRVPRRLAAHAAVIQGLRQRPEAAPCVLLLQARCAHARVFAGLQGLCSQREQAERGWVAARRQN